MNIKHNTRGGLGCTFEDMVVGEIYLSLNRCGPKPRIYMVCRHPGAPVGNKADFLVNLETGTQVAPDHRVRFRHLPDATLDTGE